MDNSHVHPIFQPFLNDIFNGISRATEPPLYTRSDMEKAFKALHDPNCPAFDAWLKETIHNKKQ